MHTVTSPQHAECFRTLVKEELPRLYSLAHRLIGDDAEDAVQDCLLKAFRGFGSLEDEAAARSWIVTILVNCCRDRGRAKARQPAEVEFEEAEEFSLYRKVADEDPFPYSDSLHLDFLAQFGKEDVHAVLQSLPDIYRTALVLVHMEGFSTKEAAQLTEAPLGTLLARLHRGRQLFMKRLWAYAEANNLLKEAAR